MGKILGIAIKNYGSLKDIKMGQLYSGQTGVPLGNMVAIIGPSGNGKSTLADLLLMHLQPMLRVLVMLVIGADMTSLFRKEAMALYTLKSIIKRIVILVQ